MAKVRILKNWGSLGVGDIAELNDQQYEFATRKGFAEALQTSATSVHNDLGVKQKGKPGRKPNAKN